MDASIVNAKELMAIDELEPNMRVLCENLVFNKTEDVTEDMLQRTAYERAYDADAKRDCRYQDSHAPLPVNVPRLTFSYDLIPPKQQQSRLRNHVPNP